MSWDRSKLFEQKLMTVPEPLRKLIYRVRDRVIEIKKNYGNLQRYGNPVFEDIKEVAAVYVANKDYRVPYDILAKFMGLNPVAIYRMLRRIEDQNYVMITIQGKREKVMVTPEDLRKIAQELVKPKPRKIEDVTQARIVQEWLKKPVRRAGAAKFGRFLSEKQIRNTLNVLRRIANYIKEYHHDLPVNPDLWTEDMIARIIEEMAKKYGWSGYHIRGIKIALRRIWPEWFRFEVGAAKSVARPKETYIPHEIFTRILESTDFSDTEKLYLKLHVTTGAREGTGASEPSSMWGLRWDKINWKERTIEVYESKTKKWWRGKLDLFFPELPGELYKIWVRLGRPEGYIWRTIGFTKTGFNRMIHDVMKRISKMFSTELRERFGTDRLVPHDLRRTHVVWLIDAGVNLEAIARSDEFDLGVGWENLDTLVVYYARFTRRRRAIELAKVQLHYMGDVSEDVVKMAGMSKEELISIVKKLA